uniref:TRP C-terminal domain-containing protein n=1 Tax=Chromera velia CCMP2878 TaxID=1169474 RepID=A0A0G4FMT9_9ALVE|eukprot:Cvel_3517.t1-p1 / transcript=Cvel_3517.t1 / gene=Cvel_3517 / organism=Chromera_velia_CCMP2878 / gene_product=hypothetical protein / transcript_product=hypothetical protein / location=Cvel_scaffold142:120302-125728(+) / protein_length=540 / sequence_SO=supercontig / SO=protein_coding / is_pseudo=false
MSLIGSAFYRLIPSFKEWELDKVYNTLGFMLQIIFVVIAVNALVPFDCVTHPSGDRTLRSFPKVFCGSEEHTSMVILGSFAIFLYLGIVPVYLAVVCVLAKPWSQKDPGFIKRNKFLFARFSPLDYWWGFVLLMKNCCFAIIPVLEPDNTVFVLVMLQALNVSFVVAQARVWPWIDTLSNWIDTALGTGISVLILVYGFYADQSGDTDFLMPATITTLALLLFSFIVVIAFQFYRWVIRAKVKARIYEEALELGQALSEAGDELSLLQEKQPERLAYLIRGLATQDMSILRSVGACRRDSLKIVRMELLVPDPETPRVSRYVSHQRDCVIPWRQRLSMFSVDTNKRRSTFTHPIEREQKTGSAPTGTKQRGSTHQSAGFSALRTHSIRSAGGLKKSLTFDIDDGLGISDGESLGVGEEGGSVLEEIAQEEMMERGEGEGTVGPSSREAADAANGEVRGGQVEPVAGDGASGLEIDMEGDGGGEAVEEMDEDLDVPADMDDAIGPGLWDNHPHIHGKGNDINNLHTHARKDKKTASPYTKE